MPIYRGRRPRTWRVTVYADGRQHEEIVEGKKSDARAHETSMRAELRATRLAQARSEPTFYAFCQNHYAPHAVLHLASSTWGVRRYQIASYLEHFGDVPLREVAKGLEGYQRAMLAKGRKPSTINLWVSVLKGMLSWALTERGWGALPSAKRLPTSGQRRVTVWTRADVRRAYASAGPSLRPMLWFMLETGLRKGETIAARWSWLDSDARMLRVPTGETEWSPKTRRARDVPLTPALLSWLRRRAGMPLEPIFASPMGGAYRQFPRHLWSEMRRRGNLRGSPHTTRHTFASFFLQRRPDLFLLARVLGHSHQRTTELYAHLLPEHLERARGAVTLSPRSRSA